MNFLRGSLKALSILPQVESQVTFGQSNSYIMRTTEEKEVVG